MKRNNGILFLLVFLGVITAYLFFDTLTQAGIEQGYNAYTNIVQNEAGAISQRVLLPHLFLAGNSSITSFAARATVLHIVAFPLWYLGLWLWLRRFGRYGLVVTVLSSIYIVLAFQAWGAMSSWSMVEMLAMVWMLVLIDRDITSLVIIVIATLNRPFTGGILALTYLLYHGKQGKSAALLLVWIGLYIGLAWLFPGKSGDLEYTISATWRRNTVVFLDKGIITVGTWSLVFWLAIKGWRRADARLRRLALAIPPYLLACVVFGTWYESSRLLLTVYPIAGALIVKGLEDEI